MLATLATIGVSIFGIGHINRHGNVPNRTAVTVTSAHVALSLPPHTYIGRLQPACTVPTDVSVQDQRTGRDIRPHWNSDHTEQLFGRVTFDGLNVDNFSNRWVNVRFRLRPFPCKRVNQTKRHW